MLFDMQHLSYRINFSILLVLHMLHPIICFLCRHAMIIVALMSTCFVVSSILGLKRTFTPILFLLSLFSLPD